MLTRRLEAREEEIEMEEAEKKEDGESERVRRVSKGTKKGYFW
jgi:hypothetical protein